MEDFDLEYDNIEPIREEPIRYQIPDREPDNVWLYDEDLDEKIKVWLEEDHCLLYFFGKLTVVGVNDDYAYYSLVDKKGLLVNVTRVRLTEMDGLLKKAADLYLTNLILR